MEPETKAGQFKKTFPKYWAIYEMTKSVAKFVSQSLVFKT